jgi:hypothetical protein
MSRTPAESTDIRTFHISQVPFAPFAIGRKGASWFLCFARPYGATGKRIHACINQLCPSCPFPSELREDQGRSKFVFSIHGPNDGIMEEMLKVDGEPVIRKTGVVFGSNTVNELPEVEILLMPAQILRCCARCNKWEALRMPRFQKCSACKLRYYCSVEVTI